MECPAQPLVTSEDLARAAQAGDQRALNALLTRHKHDAYRVALRLVGKAQDAEEVTQNALERVFKHLGRYDPERPFRPWLIGIVVNQSRSFWRLHKVKAWVFGYAMESTTNEGPHHELRKKELRHALGEALSSLPLEQREAFVLKHIEGLSYEEIAAVTGQSLGSLRVRAHRGRRAVLEWCRAHDVTFLGAGG